MRFSDPRVLILCTSNDRIWGRYFALRLWDAGFDTTLWDDDSRDVAFLITAAAGTDHVVVVWSSSARHSKWLTFLLEGILAPNAGIITALAIPESDGALAEFPYHLSSREVAVFDVPANPSDTKSDYDLEFVIQHLLGELGDDSSSNAPLSRPMPAEAIPAAGYEWSSPPSPERLSPASAPRRSPRSHGLNILVANVVALCVLLLVSVIGTISPTPEAATESLVPLQEAIPPRPLITIGAAVFALGAMLWLVRQALETIGAWKVAKALRQPPNTTEDRRTLPLGR